MAAFAQPLSAAVHVYAVGYGRMGVQKISVIVVHVVDDGFRFAVVDPAAFKFPAELGQFFCRYGHFSRFRQVLFPLGDLFRILPGDIKQEPFKVTGQENIHGRAVCRKELAVHIVHARFKEIGQDLILIGSANQLADGNAHLLGKISGQDIAEVACRHDDVKDFPFGNRAVVDEGYVRRDVIGDLREEAADVDRIGAGKQHALFVSIGVDAGVDENPLQKALGVVEVTVNRRHVDVIPFLLLHLLLLHRADAFAGIEDHDIRACHVLEAFQSRFPRIAARRRQNQDIPVFLFLGLRRRQQVREQGQCQVFEGQRAAVEQLGNADVRIDGMKGHNAFVPEGSFVIGRGDHGVAFFVRKIREEIRQDDGGDFLIRFSR